MLLSARWGLAALAAALGLALCLWAPVARATPLPSGWSSAYVDPGYELGAVSCPVASFCIAVDSQSQPSSIPYRETNQATDVSLHAVTWNGTSWSSPADLNDSGYLEGVGCAGSSGATGYCVAVDDTGTAVTYSDGAWSSSPTDIDGTHELSSVSCPAAGACVAGDDSGDVVMQSGGSWTAHDIAGTNPIEAVSCPSTSFCVAVDDNGEAFVDDDGVWTGSGEIDTDQSILTSVSCVGSTAGDGFCMAIDIGGNFLIYQNGVWSSPAPIPVSNVGVVNSVSCSGANSCMAVDGAGNELTYDGSWSGEQLDDTALTGVSCPVGTAFCAAVDNAGYAFTHGPSETSPPSAPSAWAVAADGSVALSWEPPSGVAASGYDIYVGTSPGGEAPTPVNASPVTGTTYTVTGLTDATTYYFEVRAVDGGGSSPPSAEVAATPSEQINQVWSGGMNLTSASLALQWSEPAQIRMADEDCPVALCEISGISATATDTTTGQTETDNVSPTPSDEQVQYQQSDPSDPVAETESDNLTYNLPALSPLHGQVKVTVDKQPLLDVDSRDIDYGTVPIGTYDVESVGWENVSSEPISVSAQASGSDFSLVQPAESPLQAGDFDVVLVAFSPSAEGPQSGTFTLTATSGGGQTASYQIPLLGTGGKPTLSISPSFYNYGTLSGGTSATHTFTITNVGTSATGVNGEVGAPDSPPGTIYTNAGDTCPSTGELAPGESCQLTVKFTAPNVPCGSQMIPGTILVSPPPGPKDLGEINSTDFTVAELLGTADPPDICHPQSALSGYIDPSGTVTYTAPGVTTPRPVAGASVTLSSGPSASGPFTAVPTGSSVMSPANRTNPDTTDALGDFGWDTVAGEYEVSAGRSDCSGANTSPFAIPPPQTDLTIQLSCSAAIPVATTSTTVTSDASAPVQGQPVTLTATISRPTAAGTVRFTAGSSDLGTAVVSEGIAQLTTGQLPLGADTVMASYSGDAGDTASTGVTSVTVSADPAPSVPSFVAQTPPSTATLGGDYAYEFLATGAPTYSLSGAPSWLSIDPTYGAVEGIPPAGTRSFSYAVTATNASGQTTTGTFSVAVGGPSQTISFTSTPPLRPTFGGSYTVSARGGGSGQPVVFSIDPTSSLGACAISGATVTFTGVGACVIDANQAGSSTYYAAAQAQQRLTVAKAPTTTGLTVSSRRPLFGRRVTLSATVTVAGAAAATSGGQVTFSVAGRRLGVGRLVGNVARLSESHLTLGSHRVTATFSGNTQLAASTSRSLSIVVRETTAGLSRLADDYARSSRTFRRLSGTRRRTVQSTLASLRRAITHLRPHLEALPRTRLLAPVRSAVMSLRSARVLTRSQASTIETLARRLS